ncbi:MAG: vgr related protein [Allosphingosinicella sp.]
MPATEAWRALTAGERALAATIFHGAIDCGAVRIHGTRWWPLQPRAVAMAPMGHLHIPRDGPLWSDDFAAADPGLQGLFLHELTHVWQAQLWGRWFLPLHRHPFCRYGYAIVPGRPFARYGLEQQGEIVRHVHLLRSGRRLPGAPPLAQLESILPFRPGPR